MKKAYGTPLRGGKMHPWSPRRRKNKENGYTCKVLKGQKPPTKMLYRVKLSFRSEGEVNAFPTNNPREFITCSLALLEILQGVVQAVTKRY